MNELIRVLMRRDKMTKQDVIEMILQEYDECGMDAEEALYNLGLEPDYVFDFYDIVAGH